MFGEGASLSLRPCSLETVMHFDKKDRMLYVSSASGLSFPRVCQCIMNRAVICPYCYGSIRHSGCVDCARATLAQSHSALSQEWWLRLSGCCSREKLAWLQASHVRAKDRDSGHSSNPSAALVKPQTLETSPSFHNHLLQLEQCVSTFLISSSHPPLAIQSILYME